MAFSFHMIYNIDIRSVFCVISCPNKMGFAATNIRNICFCSKVLFVSFADDEVEKEDN